MTYTLLNGNVVLLSLLNNTTAGLNFDLRWKSIKMKSLENGKLV